MGLKLLRVEDSKLVKEKKYTGLPISTDDSTFSLDLWKMKDGYKLQIEAFGTLYTLSRHRTDKSAEEAMKEAEDKIDNGYALEIMDNVRARLIEPKRK